MRSQTLSNMFVLCGQAVVMAGHKTRVCFLVSVRKLVNRAYACSQTAFCTQFVPRHRESYPTTNRSGFSSWFSDLSTFCTGLTKETTNLLSY